MFGLNFEKLHWFNQLIGNNSFLKVLTFSPKSRWRVVSPFVKTLDDRLWKAGTSTLTAGVCVSQSEQSADVAPLAVDVGRRLLLIAVKRRAGVQWRQSAKKNSKRKSFKFFWREVAYSRIPRKCVTVSGGQWPHCNCGPMESHLQTKLSAVDFVNGRLHWLTAVFILRTARPGVEPSPRMRMVGPFFHPKKYFLHK